MDTEYLRPATSFSEDEPEDMSTGRTDRLRTLLDHGLDLTGFYPDSVLTGRQLQPVDTITL